MLFEVLLQVLAKKNKATRDLHKQSQTMRKGRKSSSKCIAQALLQTPTQSLMKVYLSEDGEDKRRTNSKEMEEADDMMPM